MIEDLLKKQEELMKRVPHDVRPDSMMKMKLGIGIMDTLLRYLNSTGHKPWRPIPLSGSVQGQLLRKLEEKVEALKYAHHTGYGADANFDSLKHYSRQLISGYGVIEETLEYLNSLTDNSKRPHRLEELVDCLFFYMEQILLGEFTWQEVEAEYHRKWAVNIKRYEDAEKGDYSWDKRKDGKL